MSPKQAISLLVLMGASAAVWVPQFMGSQDEVPADMSVSPDPGALVESSLETMPTGEPSEFQGGTDLGSVPSLEQSLPGISQLITEGEEIASSATSDTLDMEALLGSLQAFRPEGVVTPAPSEGGTDTEAVPSMAGLFEVKLVMAENPLTAIIFAKSGARAIMGGRILEEGAELSTNVSIDRIEKRAVWLSSAAGPMEMTLPTLRSGPAPRSESVEEVIEWKNAEEAADPRSTRIPDQQVVPGAPDAQAPAVPSELSGQSVQGAGL